ncbi:hypothetical protein BDL97_18G041800 [Sphagnum fallax]|nr:hypothetical protein BDL97_18G041800 [Sphagnum fallax]
MSYYPLRKQGPDAFDQGYPPHVDNPPGTPSPPPSQYAAQASNQGYQQQQQQQPTSGSSGAMVVVAPEYCLPSAISLAVTKKVLSFSGGDWTISDPAGNIVFRVDGKVWTVRNRMYLVDAAGYKVISMQRKILSFHAAWHMYAGDSEQLVCTVKKSSILQLRPSMNVFLASNTTERIPDFTLKGNFLERNLTIFHGQEAIAQVTRQITFTNLLIDKDTFGITVFPGADYAFVIALLVIMDAIYLHDDQ